MTRFGTWEIWLLQPHTRNTVIREASPWPFSLTFCPIPVYCILWGLQTHSQPRCAECNRVDTNSWTVATCEPKGTHPKALKVGSGPFVQRIPSLGNLKQASEGVDGLWVNISTWPWGGLHRQEYESWEVWCGLCTSWHGTQVHTDPATRHSGSLRWLGKKKESGKTSGGNIWAKMLKGGQPDKQRWMRPSPAEQSAVAHL